VVKTKHAFAMVANFLTFTADSLTARRACCGFITRMVLAAVDTVDSVVLAGHFAA